MFYEIRVLIAHLDFNLVEGLAVVHADHRANHLRQDDHVSQVSFHNLRFLHGWCLLLGLAEAFQKGLMLSPEATVQPSPLPGTVQLHQLLAEEQIADSSACSMISCSTPNASIKTNAFKRCQIDQCTV